MNLSWSDSTGLLTASNGHTWRYTDFERFLNCAITPSMYHYMAGYVKAYLDPESFVNNMYFSNGIEARAVDAYYELPEEERREMHDQELKNIQSEICRVLKKRDAIIEAKLAFMYENPLFFAISDDVMPKLFSLEKKYNELYDRLISDEHIEEQWYP